MTPLIWPAGAGALALGTLLWGAYDPNSPLFGSVIGRGNRDGGADFVWISAWERQGELCAEYLGKGNKVAVDGRLKSRTWEQDGRRRDAVEVVARRVEFLTPPDRADGAEVIPFEAAAV